MCVIGYSPTRLMEVSPERCDEVSGHCARSRLITPRIMPKTHRPSKIKKFHSWTKEIKIGADSKSVAPPRGRFAVETRHLRGEQWAQYTQQCRHKPCTSRSVATNCVS